LDFGNIIKIPNQSQNNKIMETIFTDLDVFEINIKSWLLTNDFTKWNNVYKFAHERNLEFGLPEKLVNDTCVGLIKKLEDESLKAIIEKENIMHPIELVSLYESSEEHIKGLNDEKYATGVEELDNALEGGLQAENLAVISGYTGEGKSLFAMKITSNMIKNNIPCLWFQFELPPSEFYRKYQALGITSTMPIYVPKVYATATMDWVEAHIIKSRDKGVKVVVFDLLDFLQSGKRRIQDKNQEDAEIVTRLKMIANKYKVAIILMAHARKPSGYEREPTIYDIRGTGAITGIANWVLTVYRIKYDSKGEYVKESNTPYSLFSLQKNRINGKEFNMYGKYENWELEMVEPGEAMDEKKSGGPSAYAEIMKKDKLKKEFK